MTRTWIVLLALLSAGFVLHQLLADRNSYIAEHVILGREEEGFVDFKIPFKNRAFQRVRIGEIAASCRCVNLSLSDKEIAPFGKVEVNGRIIHEGFLGDRALNLAVPLNNEIARIDLRLRIAPALVFTNNDPLVLRWRGGERLTGKIKEFDLRPGAGFKPYIISYPSDKIEVNMVEDSSVENRFRIEAVPRNETASFMDFIDFGIVDCPSVRRRIVVWCSE